MKIGIIQGRLSPPIEGFQDTPTDWQREFNLLPKLGLNHIEWIVTKESFDNNPIFTEELNDYSISSICADNLVDERISETDFLEENLNPICKAAIKNKIKTITIPILEDSNLSNWKKREKFTLEMQEFSQRYKKLNFSFEIEDQMDVIADIIYMGENFYLTYDTGNMTTVGADHEVYLHMFIEKINNVHLKDRNLENQTVEPLTGATDFVKIFDKLSELGYNGLYPLQTAREDAGMEEETINKHINKFKELYNERT